MPHRGDVMIYKSDKTSLTQPVRKFTWQIQVLDIPNKIKPYNPSKNQGGYTPTAFVKCGNAPCKLMQLNWKMGKETGGKRVANPPDLKSNEMWECVFEPQQPIVVDSFKNCEGLSRIAFVEGEDIVMLGKVVSCGDK